MLDGSETGEVNALAITKEGNHFVSGGEDKEVKLWGYDEGICYFSGKGHSGTITRVIININIFRLQLVQIRKLLFLLELKELYFYGKCLNLLLIPKLIKNYQQSKKLKEPKKPKQFKLVKLIIKMDNQLNQPRNQCLNQSNLQIKNQQKNEFINIRNNIFNILLILLIFHKSKKLLILLIYYSF